LVFQWRWDVVRVALYVPQASELFSEPPAIQKVDVLASHLR
jgi:hypothetical protein